MSSKPPPGSINHHPDHLRPPTTTKLGEATGLLSLAKARKRNKAREKGESKGLLDSAGITVPDPKVGVCERERGERDRESKR